MSPRTLSASMMSASMMSAAILAGLLVGCSPTPVATPTPPEAEQSVSPTPTASVSSSPTASERLDDAELIRLCIAASPHADRPTRTYHVDQARVEDRDVDPAVLVYIPITDADPALAFSEMALYCTMAGTSADPSVPGTTERTPMTEAEIQQLIAANEESDGPE